MTNKIPGIQPVRPDIKDFVAGVQAGVITPGPVTVTNVLDPDHQAQDVRLAPNAMPSVLLLGEQGHGKTTAIRTLLDCGFDKVFVLALEPGIADILGDTDPTKVHWAYVNPYKAKMSDLIAGYKTMQSMSYDTLQKQGHIQRERYQQYIEVMQLCNNFKCARTGEEFGPVSEWPTNYALVVDGLSGLNSAVQHFMIGIKPFLELRDYQAIQNTIYEFLNCLIGDSKCFVALMAHVAQEIDEINNLSILTMDTIGRKLAPKLGRFFSDIILTERVTKDDGNKFQWVTQSAKTKLKSRNLPLSKSLQPSFKPLLDAWRAKQVPKVG